MSLCTFNSSIMRDLLFARGIEVKLVSMKLERSVLYVISCVISNVWYFLDSSFHSNNQGNLNFKAHLPQSCSVRPYVVQKTCDCLVWGKTAFALVYDVHYLTKLTIGKGLRLSWALHSRSWDPNLTISSMKAGSTIEFGTLKHLLDSNTPLKLQV